MNLCFRALTVMHFLGCVRAQVGNECVYCFEKFLIPVCGVLHVLVSVQTAPQLCALCVLVCVSVAVL